MSITSDAPRERVEGSFLGQPEDDHPREMISFWRCAKSLRTSAARRSPPASPTVCCRGWTCSREEGVL